MSKFTVRIVLHGAEWSEYQELHEFMESYGFDRTVTDTKGITYELPPGEYSMFGYYSLAAVKARAKSAAQLTGRLFGVFVTAAKGRTWMGLKKAARRRVAR